MNEERPTAVTAMLFVRMFMILEIPDFNEEVIENYNLDQIKELD